MLQWVWAKVGQRTNVSHRSGSQVPWQVGAHVRQVAAQVFAHVAAQVFAQVLAQVAAQV